MECIQWLVEVLADFDEFYTILNFAEPLTRTVEGYKNLKDSGYLKNKINSKGLKGDNRDKIKDTNGNP